MRAAYLGPPGTNSHEALVSAGLDVEPVPLPSIAGLLAQCE
jgi:prephenate dehydratase